MSEKSEVFHNVSIAIRCAACQEPQNVTLSFHNNLFGLYHCKKCSATNKIKCKELKEYIAARKVCDSAIEKIRSHCHFESVLLNPDEYDDQIIKYFQEQQEASKPWPLDLPPDKTCMGS